MRSSLPLLLSFLLVQSSFSASLPAAPPEDARALLDKGVSLQKQAKFDEAIRTLESAVDLDVGDELAAEVRVELAKTFFQKGKAASEGRLEDVDYRIYFRRAEKTFSEVIARYSRVKDEAAYAAYMIGSCHLLLGDMKKAYEAYKKAYYDHADSEMGPKALARIGVTLAGLGDSTKAIRIFRAFLERYPDDPSAKKVKRYIGQVSFVGSRAPRIQATRWLNGVAPAGLEDLRGEVVVLVFFGTWCKQCTKELPHLKRAIRRWRDNGVVFLGIADPDDEKVREPVEFYVKKNKLNFLDVALDSGGRSWRPYRVTGLPAAAIIDRKGIVRWRGHFAFMGHTLLERLLREDA